MKNPTELKITFPLKYSYNERGSGGGGKSKGRKCRESTILNILGSFLLGSDGKKETTKKRVKDIKLTSQPSLK